ncbi:hypothetical protein Pla123a_45900 [Posidoniimonas polymericola]|uniref:Uncharacterized protein n=1 Tax=Posidoniimonas polymericola TaxID=2528002 RepID=A0A5C5XWL4_9BACT|nr:PEP-CTERM sorting domain-containing protein [Posidoniimonas polymericola]TWT66889.1 hypothetical protein Pla123a_45900 [Posidoniimonas polymericola]
MINSALRLIELVRRHGIAVGAAAALAATAPSAHALVTLSADPAVPTGAVVETLNPENFSPASRGIAGTRQLRMTFQNPTEFVVGEIILAVDLNGNDGGMVLDFYEVEDVNASGWAPIGDPLETITLGLDVDLPATTERLSLALTESNLFTLPARNTDAQGYGIEISNLDQATSLGLLRHSNSGADEFIGGTYYDESGGAPASGTRDWGIWLLETNEAPPVPGDTDGDMVVELFDDLDPIRTNYLQPVTFRSEGDLNGDEFVDFADFRQWKDAYLATGATISASDIAFLNVPEPSAVCLLLMGLSAAARRRSRG